MSSSEKKLPDRLYEASQNDTSQRKNSSAVGAGGEKAAYCVDGAVLSCTMGSASSMLRVEDHGLRLTDRAAAHDGDRAPGKNISPFGNCKLKDNHPCSPAPIARWLLQDEYTVIGSCYSGKKAQFQQATQLMERAREELKALHRLPVLLSRQDMPLITPDLRREIFRASSAIKYERERVAIWCARVFTSMDEIAEYFTSINTSMDTAEKAMNKIKEAFPNAANYGKEMTKAKDLLNAGDYYKSILKNTQKVLLQGLGNGEIIKMQTLFSEIESHVKEAKEKTQGIIDSSKAFVEAESVDQGCQITTDSIIPCQVGGVIHF